MSCLGFTHAVFDGRLPGFERVVCEYINPLWVMLIEGHGVSEPAARNKVQSRRGDGFPRGGSGIEEKHFIFEAGRRLWRQNAGCSVGNDCHGRQGSSIVVYFFPASRCAASLAAVMLCLYLYITVCLHEAIERIPPGALELPISGGFRGLIVTALNLVCYNLKPGQSQSLRIALPLCAFCAYT